jgi:hypothetical protein
MNDPLMFNGIEWMQSDGVIKREHAVNAKHTETTLLMMPHLQDQLLRIFRTTYPTNKERNSSVFSGRYYTPFIFFVAKIAKIPLPKVKILRLGIVTCRGKLANSRMNWLQSLT